MHMSTIAQIWNDGDGFQSHIDSLLIKTTSSKLIPKNYLLTPEGQMSFFSNKCSNLSFLAQEAQTNFYSIFCNFNCMILP
jgi:hypothetical protein